MKIAVFNGSPHSERGNTQVLVDAFAAGAREAGAEVECHFLAKKKITHCTACLACWIKTPGVCAIRDDMDELRPKFLEADLVVLATPIYVENVTGMIKLFIDRLVPIIDPRFEADELGERRHVKRYERYPNLAIIASGGYIERAAFEVVSHYVKRLAREIFAELRAEIFCGGGLLLKMGEGAPLGPIVDGYKKSVESAGREVVENGAVTEETAKKLAQLLVPPDMYYQQANMYWESRLKKLEAK